MNHPASRPFDLSRDPLHASSPSQSSGATTRGADRNQTRRGYEVEVGVATDHNFYTGFTENISCGGLFVATRDIMPIGSRFQLTLRLPNFDRDVVVNCEVRWQRLEQIHNSDIHPGMGVRFIDLPDSDAEIINAFLVERETIFYDDE